MEVRTISVAGARVRVLALGDGARRDAALCIHGVGGWAENWRETLPAIAATGRRAFAVDLPGFGESAAVRGARYFDAARPFYATFVGEVIDALGLPRVHLVGHSLGGAVAFMGAAARPDRVRSLTLVAPAGLGDAIP
ncbi:MAG: alpha/beta fold hydrolase, partial [Candidatus Limnocylindria bacterium]